ncbi:MAG TPA: hypothetical protein VG737_04730 [Cyclobacteriaceae bacterium]|nr:hypothetical protein [Cyclobacteriaceae bacterium]
MKVTHFVFFAVLGFLSLRADAQAIDGWKVEAANFDRKNYFGVTLGNGMIGLVSSAEPMKVKDVVLNGVYDYYQRGRVSNILKSFNHVNLDLDVDGIRMSSNEVRNYRQSLDMKSATFETTFEVADKLSVKHTMMSLRHLPYCAMTVVEIKATKDVVITPMSVIEAPDHLSDVRNLFSQVDRPHVTIPLLTSVAKSPSGKHTVAASNSIIFTEQHGQEPQVIHEDWDYNRHLMKFSKKLLAGETYSFTIVSSATSTAHFGDPMNEAERLTIFARLEGTQKLLQRHKEEWDKLWQSDIIVSGDPGVQRDIRFALYNLYSFVREGTGYSLSPMGLSGLGYNGHVFWDTELWMYPPLLMLQPQIARSVWTTGLTGLRLRRKMQSLMDIREPCFRGSLPTKELRIPPYGPLPDHFSITSPAALDGRFGSIIKSRKTSNG